MKKNKKILHPRQTACRFIALPVICAAVLLLFVLFVIAKRYGIRFYVITSGSMEPALGVGSVVCLCETPFFRLAQGDIIGFQAGDTTVVHRIKGIDRSRHLLYTKGDSNQTSDMAPVAESDVIGRAVFVIPFAGKLPLFFQSHLKEVVVILSAVFSGMCLTVRKRR